MLVFLTSIIGPNKAIIFLYIFSAEGHMDKEIKKVRETKTCKMLEKFSC